MENFPVPFSLFSTLLTAGPNSSYLQQSDDSHLDKHPLGMRACSWDQLNAEGWSRGSACGKGLQIRLIAPGIWAEFLGQFVQRLACTMVMSRHRAAALISMSKEFNRKVNRKKRCSSQFINI